jgi:hypothetical protein
MAKVTGLGGAFLRAENPKALYGYEKHLAIAGPEGCFSFPRERQRAYIPVAFPKNTYACRCQPVQDGRRIFRNRCLRHKEERVAEHQRGAAPP